MVAVGEIIEFGRPMKSHFLFDAKWTNLNHGSFGTYPLPVRNALRGYQKLAELAPDRFIKYQCIDLLDKARDRVAKLINADVAECVFVLNATTGFNTILRNLTYKDKDAIIYFDTIYGACENTLFSLQETNPQIHLRKTISRLIYEGYTPKVAVFDTIASVPGVRFPFERLTSLCKEYHILSVIDGAHGIGHIPLDMASLKADFLVSNCHKWLFTPRACCVMYVPERNQHLIRTSYPTSFGFKPQGNSSKVYTFFPETSKTEFERMFEYVGTSDDSAYYCVPAAMNFRQNLCGGEEAIYNYIRDVAQRGADLLAAVLGTEVMDDLDPGEGLKAMGSYEAGERRNQGRVGWSGGIRDCALANVLLPIQIAGSQRYGSLSLGPGGAGSGGGLLPGLHGGRKFSWGYSSPQRSPISPTSHASWASGWKDSESAESSSAEEAGPVVVQQGDVATHIHWMLKTLVNEYNTNIQIFEYNGKLWTRVSGQIYLELRDFEWLGGVLKGLCERVRMGESLTPAGNMGRASTVQASSHTDLEALGNGIATM